MSESLPRNEDTAQNEILCQNCVLKWQVGAEACVPEGHPGRQPVVEELCDGVPLRTGHDVGGRALHHGHVAGRVLGGIHI